MCEENEEEAYSSFNRVCFPKSPLPRLIENPKETPLKTRPTITPLGCRLGHATLSADLRPPLLPLGLSLPGPPDPARRNPSLPAPPRPISRSPDSCLGRMDSDVEMNAASDEEVMDDEDYYDYCDSDMGDDGDGGSEEEELVAGDYDEGIEAEGTDEVVSRREQVRPMLRA